MSIGYNCNYGIGYRVSEGDSLIDSEQLEEGLSEYLYSEVGQGFESFQNGNSLSGECGGTYIVIMDPMKYGLDLTKAKDELDAEIKRLDLYVESNFGVVGGLHIW